MRVAHFYACIKLHKTPYGWRFVAGSAKAPMRKLSVCLSKALKVCQSEASALWNDVVGKIPGAKPRGSWIISDSEAARDLVRSCILPRRLRSLPRDCSTYDFSTMYTTVRLDDLKQKMRTLISEIFAMKLKSKRARFLLVRADGTHEWISTRRALSNSKEYIF